MKKLSILIPVYNEQYTIEEVIERVLRAPLPGGLDREIVVVDDASRDATFDALQRAAKSFPSVKLIRHERNQGKGAAIRTAIRQATGDVIIFQDADLEYDPNDYAKLLEPILAGDADVVYGSRFFADRPHRVLCYWHSVGNRFLTMLSNMMTDLNLSDMETCYKVSRAEILKSIPIRCDRFGMEPELTAKFAKRGCRIFEVSVSYKGRTYQEGKKITWRDGLKALFVIFYFKLVDDLYDEQYDHSILHSLSGTHRFNRWMADTIAPWVGDDVLEIGAGLGNLTQKFLPRKSYVVSDIDPIYLNYLPNVFEMNRRVSVMKLNVESAEDFQSIKGRFDTVICLNVIEHVEHDVQAMKNIHEALRPGGRACILVPRSPALFGTLDEVLGHFRRYDRNELADKLNEAGFEVERVFSFNRVTVPAWWFNARVVRRRHFGKVQLKMFDSSIWLWRRMDRYLPWQGISLIAIGRKPA